MASYLVTGGAGFIGSHLAEELVRRGHAVRVADSLITGKRAQSRRISRAWNSSKATWRTPRVAAPRRRAAWSTCCIRRRSRRCRGRSRIPITSNRANVDATLNVLVAARDAGVKRARLRRIVVGVRRTRRRCPSARTCRPTRCRPTRCRSWWRNSIARCSRSSMGWRRSRPATSTSSGRGRIPARPYSGVISLFSTALLDGRQPTIYGDGEQTRDFTYVANVVDGVLRAAEATDVAGEVMNVADRRPHLPQRAPARDERDSGNPHSAAVRGAAGR